MINPNIQLLLIFAVSLGYSVNGIPGLFLSLTIMSGVLAFLGILDYTIQFRNARAD